MMMQKYDALIGMVIASVGVGLAGCSQTNQAAPTSQMSDDGHHHDGWWCDEHGVPEEVCALCNKKVAADFKAKGDWCAEHDRPESQCFICHPEKEADFAALYEAKYGRKPPKVEHGDDETALDHS